MSEQITPEIVKNDSLSDRILISYSDKFNEIVIFNNKGYELEDLSNQEYFGVKITNFNKDFLKFPIINELESYDPEANKKIQKEKEKYSALPSIQLNGKVIYAGKLENLAGIGLKYQNSIFSDHSSLESDLEPWLKQNINMQEKYSKKVINFIAQFIQRD